MSVMARRSINLVSILKTLPPIIVTATVAIASLWTYQTFFLTAGSHTNFKDAAQGVQSITTSIALVVGGIWTYRKFFEYRKNKPKATMQQQIVTCQLTPTKRLLRDEVMIKNESEVLLTIDRGKIWLQQVLPLVEPLEYQVNDYKRHPEYSQLWRQDMQQIQWAYIDEREIRFLRMDGSHARLKLEPGESSTLYYDFLLDATIAAVLLSVYVEDIHQPGSGWTMTTLHHIASAQTALGGTHV